MHIALDRGHDHLALRARVGVALLLCLDERDELRDGAFHDTRALHDLWEEHLAAAKEVADDLHPVHERALDDLDRPVDDEPRLLGVGDDVVGDPMDERVGEAFGDRSLAPAEIHGLRRDLALHALGDLEETLGRIRPAREHDVLDPREQLRRDVGVLRERAGIHDAHVHAGVDRVVQEHGVDRLADAVVAAERE